MSHEVEFNKLKGTHSFYSRKEIAWHGLGQVVEEAKTSDEVLEIANLDFNVVKVPNYAGYQENGERHYLENKESFSTVRTDNKTILGTVGTRYEILQNSEAFNFFDDIVGGKQAIFETAGVLYQGQKVFITAKLPDYIRFSNNDVIEQYLLLTNDHTGRESAVITFTPVRVVCNNTLNMALAGARNAYRLRHTKSIKDRMDEVVTMMGLKNLYFEEVAKVAEEMKGIKVTERDTKLHIMELVLNKEEFNKAKNFGLHKVEEISTRKKNTITEMYNWIEKGDGQDMYRGTGLWLYNGVNGYFNNGKNYKDAETRMENLIGGSASQVINKSQNLLIYG